jgi:hypothetical protein
MITITGEPKEIAALVQAIQEQPERVINYSFNMANKVADDLAEIAEDVAKSMKDLPGIT